MAQGLETRQRLQRRQVVVPLELPLLPLPLLLPLVASQLFGVVVLVAASVVLLHTRLPGPPVPFVAGRLDVAAGRWVQDAVAGVGLPTADALVGVASGRAETPHVGAVVTRAHLAITDVAKAPSAVPLETVPVTVHDGPPDQGAAQAGLTDAVGGRPRGPVDDGSVGAAAVGEAAPLQVIGDQQVAQPVQNSCSRLLFKIAQPVRNSCSSVLPRYITVDQFFSCHAVSRGRKIMGQWWVCLRARKQSPTRPFSYSMT